MIEPLTGCIIGGIVGLLAALFVEYRRWKRWKEYDKIVKEALNSNFAKTNKELDK